MKVLLFIFFFITICFVHYSLEETTGETKFTEEITVATETTTTTPWWTRTFPIIPPKTITPPPKKPLKTTTKLVRVSDTVAITVPVVLFGVTIIVGFGLIAYASFTGGNGIFFLTRSNEREIP